MTNEEVIWLSPEEAAKKLGVSRVTMYRYLNDLPECVPSYKIGGVVRIKLDELNKWVESHKTN